MKTYEFAKLLNEHGIKVSKELVRINVQRFIKGLNTETLIEFYRCVTEDRDHTLMKYIERELKRRGVIIERMGV